MSESLHGAHALDAFMANVPSQANRACEVRVMVRRQCHARNIRVFDGALAASGTELGIANWPETNQWIEGDGVVYWLGPDEWLLVGGETGSEHARLADDESLPTASVNDVTGAWVQLDLLGPGVRPLLEKACTIDLAPEHSGAGQCAQTLLAKTPVVLATHADAERVTLLLRRSFAEHVANWLLASGPAGATGFCFDDAS